MKLRYTPEASNDWAGIKQYSKEASGSLIAAGKIISVILAGCRLLKSQPRLGMELSKRAGRETERIVTSVQKRQERQRK